jgi:hypothetical protein
VLPGPQAELQVERDRDGGAPGQGHGSPRRRLLARREAPVVSGRAGLVDNASHDEDRQAWPT